MNDPKRLREEMDSELGRVLLRAGTRSPWPNSRRNRVLAALGVGLVLTSTKQTAFAALATWQKVVLVGCVACAGAAGGVVAVRQAAMSEAPLSNSALAQQGEAAEQLAPGSHEPEPRTVEPVAGEPKREIASEPAIETAVAVDDEVAADEEAARPRVVSEPRKRSVTSSATPPSQVRQELAMLENARQSMRAGEGGQALSALRAYSRRFPKGTLRFEAEVLRIEALAAQGRKAEASKRARRILERNPRSVVAARLERYVTD